MTRRLYFLDQARGAVLTVLADGTEVAVLAAGCAQPDGITADSQDGHLYWTNMGVDFDAADGSIERMRLDGSGRSVIVPAGETRTPKQLRLDKAGGHIYWCDREGMCVQRSRLDGSGIETLIRSGDAEADRGDATRWCVGIALDTGRRHFYWTQKGPTGGGKGRIFRASMDLPADPANREDVELLFDHLPEPVDLELSPDGRWLYWSDRAAMPGGNSISRAAIDPSTGRPGPVERLVEGLDRAIGLSVDFAGNRLFATDLGGSIYAADLLGAGWTRLVAGAGKLTGICHL